MRNHRESRIATYYRRQAINRNCLRNFVRETFVERNFIISVRADENHTL